LRTTADDGLLGLHESTELALSTEFGARTDVGERTDGGLIADLRAGAVRADHRGAGTDDHICQGGVRSDLRPVADSGGSQQLGARIDDDIAADGDLNINPGGPRIND